jgi:maltose/moltooligosaccharide transporter
MINKKIFYLTICSFGIGLASTLQIANLSTILQFAGFKAHVIGYLWLIAPLTGMICQPVIGLLSDNLYTQYGRRRPLFLASTLMGFLGLLFLPFTQSSILLIALIVLLDIGANGNAQLARALILDLTRGKERVKSFSWATALAGLGAMSAGVLPWILLHFCSFAQGEAYQLPAYIRATFLTGAILYLFFSLITFFMVKERNVKKRYGSQITYKDLLPFAKIIAAMKKLPGGFWKLSYTLFFAWIAIFSLWNYLNIDIAQAILHMPPMVTDDLEKSGRYLAQANVLTSFYFSILQLSSTLFALSIPALNRRFSIKQIFTMGLMIGGFSLIIMALTSNKYFMVLLMIFYGITWATLSICPYDIFAKLISKKNYGFYMGIFNLAIVLPQIIIGLFLGVIFKYFFSSQAYHIILMAGIFLLASSLFNLKQRLRKINMRERESTH